jgi:hypothetical protein
MWDILPTFIKSQVNARNLGGLLVHVKLVEKLNPVAGLPIMG